MLASKPGGKEKWKCEHGCKNNKSMCTHLNALLPVESGQSVRATPTGKIDRFYYDSGAGYVLPKEIRDRTWELQFRERLTKTKLEPIKVDILVCRFVHDMSMSEISTELGMLSASTVLRLLNDSLEYLKRIGFKK